MTWLHCWSQHSIVGRVLYKINTSYTWALSKITHSFAALIRPLFLNNTLAIARVSLKNNERCTHVIYLDNTRRAVVYSTLASWSMASTHFHVRTLLFRGLNIPSLISHITMIFSRVHNCDWFYSDLILTNIYDLNNLMSHEWSDMMICHNTSIEIGKQFTTSHWRLVIVLWNKHNNNNRHCLKV